MRSQDKTHITDVVELTTDNGDNNNAKTVPDAVLSQRRRNDSTEGVWSGEDEACAVQNGAACIVDDGAACSTRPRRACAGEPGSDESSLSSALESHCRLL